MFGDVFLPAMKKPKSTKPAQRRHALKVMGRKRLGPAKAQRRAHHLALEKWVGHSIPKLSDVANPRRHSVKARIRTQTGEILVPTPRRGRRRKSQGGGKRGEGQVQRGTMASKRSKAKAAKSGARRGGKKGAKAGREPKKKGK